MFSRAARAREEGRRLVAADVNGRLRGPPAHRPATTRPAPGAGRRAARRRSRRRRTLPRWPGARARTLRSRGPGLVPPALLAFAVVVAVPVVVRVLTVLLIVQVEVVQDGAEDVRVDVPELADAVPRHLA